MMDKELIMRRFSKAAAGYDKEADVQRRIAATMTVRLKAYIPSPNVRSLLEVGCGTGVFSRMLLREFSPARMLLNDLCPEMEHSLKDILNPDIRFRPGDAEQYPFPDMYDLIASCSALQWFRDPEAFFTKACTLQPAGGLLAFSTFGGENLKEIAALTGQSLAYLPVRELAGALSGSYDILHASEEHITKTFHTPQEALYHLKQTGVTGIVQQQWSKGRLQRFCSEYNRLFGGGRLLPLTYHPIYIIAKKKSQ